MKAITHKRKFLLHSNGNMCVKFQLSKFNFHKKIKGILIETQKIIRVH